MKHKILTLDNLVDGARYKITLKIPFNYGWIERVKITFLYGDTKSVYQLNHVKNEDEYAFFETTVELKTQAVYFYYFSFYANGVYQYYKKTNLTGNNSLKKEECWKLSVGFEAPDWAKGAVMYQIFPDRFRKGKNTKMEFMPKRTIHENWGEKPVIGPDENGNWNIDFFGGNLKGIEESLNYIKSLGTSIIYLNPIVKSQSNHRYDTADYMDVDPYFGTIDELKTLINAIHKKGMKIIADMVFNHTGNDSKYFNQYGTYDTVGAYQSKDSPYYNFYKKRYYGGKTHFEYWWGMTNLPECDCNSPDWRNYTSDVIKFYMSLGFDGIRYDVIDELTDDFIEINVASVKQNNPDALIIGEVWYNPMRMGRRYLSSGKGMHSVMNYYLIDALIGYFKYGDINTLRARFNEILTEYPDDTIFTLMNFTSTHDISRIIEIYGYNGFDKYGEWNWDLPKNTSYEWINEHHLSGNHYRHGKMVYKSHFFALSFLPGILSIFYGDEVGTQGIGNLANRAPFPWGKEDKDLLKFVRRTVKARNNNTFLRTAQTNIIKIDSEQFVFERYNNQNEGIWVCVSRTHHETNVDLPEKYRHGAIIAKIKGCDKNHLSPYGAIAIKK